MKSIRPIQFTVVNLSFCLLISICLLTDIESIKAQNPQTFLGPIFYGNEEVSGIFDHNLPLPSLVEGDNRDGNECTQHNDGTPCRDNPPFGLGYDGHDGIDYDLNYKPVIAASSGIVAEAGWSNTANHQRGLGLRIKIDHVNRYTTEYGHLSAIMVSWGQPVITDSSDRKNIIAISGNTGNSNGSHLHFGVINDSGLHVNPYGWQGPAGQDPWANYVDPQGIPGATSNNLWEQRPAITTGQYLLPGAPIDEPFVDDDPLIELDDSDSADFSAGSCWTPQEDTGSINGEHHIAVGMGLSNCSARWTIPAQVVAPAGEYDVYVHIPDGATTNHAYYKVRHAQTDDMAIVVQAAYPDNTEHDAWAYLGRYYFRMNGYDLYHTEEYIELTNETILDSIGQIVAADAVRLYPANQPPDKEFSVSQSEDDAGGPNQTTLGICSAESYALNEIYLGHCNSGVPTVSYPTISGFRFPEVDLPDDVTITNARLEFTVDGIYYDPLDVQFQGELADNAVIFNNSLPINRSPLTNAVPWHITSDEVWYTSEIHTSPDLSSIVQEVIDQPGWHSGNAIVIIVKPTGSLTTTRRIIGWERNDNSILAAKLQIWYTEPTPPTPTPVPSPTPSVPPAPRGLTAVYATVPSPSTSELKKPIITPEPVTVTPGYVRLTWQGSSYPAGTTFNVYRSFSNPVPLEARFRIAANLTQPRYTDFAGQIGYWYVVTAVNAVGESLPSNHAQASPYCPDC